MTMDFRIQLTGPVDDLPAPKEGDVLHQPTADLPFSVTMGEIRAGKTIIYETRTGEPRLVNNFNLGAALRKVHKDPTYPEYLGMPVFSRVPTKEFVQGTFSCWMNDGHPEVERYRRYLGAGFKPCIAAKLPSPYMAEQHMQKRHKAEYATIKAAEDREQRQEDRDLNRQVLVALSAAVGKQVPQPEQSKRRKRTKAA